MKNFERFYISQVGILIRDNKVLILEFSKHPGKWGLPGGRMDKDEAWEEAFRREIREELGFNDFAIGELLGVHIFHSKTGRPVCAVVRKIENNSDDIKLSYEHSSCRWIEKKEIDKINFIWDGLEKFIKKGFN